MFGFDVWILQIGSSALGTPVVSPKGEELELVLNFKYIERDEKSQVVKGLSLVVWVRFSLTPSFVTTDTQCN
ncbi:hypothetical protein AgCh_029934 [Apium graveolens]